MFEALESNSAEMGPIELAIKYRGKSKKGFSVCPVTLDKVALGIVLHVVSYCVAVFVHVASPMVGCCMGVAAAYAVLHMVGYYIMITTRVKSCPMLGMLLQFGCCIRDVAAAAIAAPPKFPEAM